MKKTRTQKALKSQQQAVVASAQGRHMVGYYNAQTEELMQPESLPVIAHGEVLPQGDTTAAFVIKDTLEDPDTPAVDASEERVSLLLEAGALEIGIDAATSIQARNSFEKMLAHQMAVCHTNGMKLMAEAMAAHPGDLTAQSLQIKKINLAARLMDSFQKGMDTLTRTRTAGRQTIVVKQVHVTGGQNIISDQVTTGGPKGDGRSENGITP
jgi:porphobilinogen deaminase